MIALVLPSPGTYGGVLQTFPSEAYTGQTSGVIGLYEHGHVHQRLWVVTLGDRVVHPSTSSWIAQAATEGAKVRLEQLPIAAEKRSRGGA